MIFICQDVPKPKLSNENLIINELIREYFEYNGYRHALSVFLPGTGYLLLECVFVS